MKEKFDVTLIVFGEPASKANSRRLVTIKGRGAIIKSKKAIDYIDSFKQQCAIAMAGVAPTDKVVRVEALIYYASNRPDLDESVILDAMQGIVYMNDRQVKQKAMYWGLDRDLPRAIIRVVECDPSDIPAHLLDNIDPMAGGVALKK